MAQSFTKRFTDRVSAHLGKRSNKWPKVRNAFHKANPTCALCGRIKKAQVHHVEDFSTNPELELDWDNLITLCMGTYKCHLLLGHLMNFKSINPHVRKDAARLSYKIKHRRK